ncbi:MAG: hypothetical protein FWD31_05435, partial [Planctomycetaceae bacterium]|nr:hypothetical protein [Planctomycetaceae bacterium]
LWGLLSENLASGQGLRERWEAYQQEQKLKEINSGIQSNGGNAEQTSGGQSASGHRAESRPQTSGFGLRDEASHGNPANHANPVNPANPASPANSANPEVRWRAAQQSSQSTADEATIRKALLRERLNDARLNDVIFATPLIGWAVGDCGVIWHTQNGGRNWQLQDSGTDCPLFGVDFIDPHNGFAVGGATEPYSRCGRGVVLRTTDGGQRWERVTTFAFPILSCVRIDSPGRLWVAGSASEKCPTGILLSPDNGQTWQVQPGVKNEGWASLGFRDTSPGVQVGAGIGLDGTIQAVRDKTTRSQTPPLGLRRANAVDIFTPRPVSTQSSGMTQQVVSPYTGWLVGDGGVIICTRSTGMTWEVPQGFLPIHRPDLFDFQTVFARDTNVWVAGNPGTQIFYSNDSGANWYAARSGISTPIRKIRFVSPQLGYAVGDLGTILASGDGGRSWQVQRAGGTRLAVLGIFGRVQDVPYEVLAKLCLEEGYLGGVNVVFRQDSMRRDDNEIPAMRRLHEALVHCGGSSSTQPWAFSMDHDELPGHVERILARLESENDGHGLARLREHLVATIRTWRPNVVLAPGNAPSDDMGRDAARDLLSREIVWAVQAAANPMMFPEQLTETGLQAWQVDKVHLCCNPTVIQQNDAAQQRLDASAIGNIQIRTSTLAPRYGKTYSNMAQTARRLFDAKPALTEAIVSFRTVFDVVALQQNRDPAELNRTSLTGAISLPGGSEARRAMQPMSMVSHYERIHQQTRHQDTIRDIIGTLGRGGQLGDANRMLAQIDALTQRLDPETTVQTLLEIGDRLHHIGQWEAASEVYLRLVRDYPTHDATKVAYAWLLQYTSSFDEREHTASRGSTIHVVNATFDVRKLDNEKLGQMTEELGLRSPDSQRNRNLVDWSTGETKSSNQFDKARLLAEFVHTVSPEVLNDPRVRFCLAAAQVANGEQRLAEGYYIKRGMPPNDDLWAVRAASELVANGGTLGQNQTARQLPTIRCRLTSERPFLDGKLDDDLWSQCVPTLFSSAVTPADLSQDGQTMKTSSRDDREQTGVRSHNLGTEAMFQYDREFLYVALRCRKTQGFAYHYQDFRTIPRTHDPNLSREDRVEMLLDQKRNYTTYDTFELDYRGWISESRWGDKNWNPRWFVARHEDETHWYVEAAIPLDQLTDKKPKPGTRWGIALRRIVPGVGIDAWNVDYSFNTREGFGYLVFE